MVSPTYPSGHSPSTVLLWSRIGSLSPKSEVELWYSPSSTTTSWSTSSSTAISLRDSAHLISSRSSSYFRRSGSASGTPLHVFTLPPHRAVLQPIPTLMGRIRREHRSGILPPQSRPEHYHARLPRLGQHPPLREQSTPLPFFAYDNKHDPYNYQLTMLGSLAIWGSELLSSFVARQICYFAFRVDVTNLGLDEMREFPELLPTIGWGAVHTLMDMLLF